MIERLIIIIRSSLNVLLVAGEPIVRVSTHFAHNTITMLFHALCHGFLCNYDPLTKKHYFYSHKIYHGTCQVVGGSSIYVVDFFVNGSFA